MFPFIIPLLSERLAEVIRESKKYRHLRSRYTIRLVDITVWYSVFYKAGWGGERKERRKGIGKGSSSLPTSLSWATLCLRNCLPLATTEVERSLRKFVCEDVLI